ncbi:aspartate/glutamate racemase family protein [Leucobacter soli]|uniref:aspartate/glutamate racemase family protein n=1 Tax=Leucobacter soli TaxID=2812850 RepID=UPI003609A7BD
MTRICFLNPFCGDRADSLIEETVSPYLRNGTTVDVWHHKTGPDFPDYYVSKHLTEVEIMRSAVAAERAGYDAFVIGCSYDPGLTQCRELVNIPVVGPLESSTALARSFGHRYSVLTDHHKAVPELEDRLRVYGTSANCRSVRAIDWFDRTCCSTSTRSPTMRGRRPTRWPSGTARRRSSGAAP